MKKHLKTFALIVTTWTVSEIVTQYRVLHKPDESFLAFTKKLLVSQRNAFKATATAAEMAVTEGQSAEGRKLLNEILKGDLRF